jgi:hypothetical protein
MPAPIWGVWWFNVVFIRQRVEGGLGGCMSIYKCLVFLGVRLAQELASIIYRAFVKFQI